MYLSTANHLGLHISEPIYKKVNVPCNPRSASVNGCSYESPSSRLGPNLSNLIYIYKSKITKYMYVAQCPIHRNRKKCCYTSSRALWKSLLGSFLKSEAISVWRILYPLHEMVIQIFTKAHILFCLPCSRYTLVFFLVSLVGPLNPWAPGRCSGWPLSQWAWL